MIRRINIALVGIILLSGILNASVADSVRTRYSVGIQLGAMYFPETILYTFHVSPLVEIPLDNNFLLGLSPALGIGLDTYVMWEYIFPDLLLQCDIIYVPDKIRTMYYIAGAAFKKPFYDDIEVGKRQRYKTHKWHENFHITAGLGFRWTSFALDFLVICPMFPLVYRWDYFYTTRYYSRYAYLSIGFRFMIKGR